MKRFIAAFFLLVSSFCYASRTSLFDADLNVLLEVMDVPHEGTPESIVEATQKRWTRPAGKELWEVKDTVTATQKAAVIDYCTKKGFLKEIKPAHLQYDYAILLGATVYPMEKCMAYLAKLAESGVQFKNVILLSGARPLDAAIEPLLEGCKTEGDAMEYLWKAHPLSKKVAWKHYQHPMITLADGKTRRPSRIDTFDLWMKDSPEPGRCFFVYIQPYLNYQTAVAENHLPKTFLCETVGPAAEVSNQNTAKLLDTIARCLYETNKSSTKKLN